MAEARRRFDEDFKQAAVRLVRETGKPIAQVARELRIDEGTLGNWCAQNRRRQGSGALSESEREELARLSKGERRAADAVRRAQARRGLLGQGCDEACGVHVTTLMPSAVNTASNDAGNLPSRSRISSRNRPACPPVSTSKFRACWVTHARPHGRADGDRSSGGGPAHDATATASPG